MSDEKALGSFIAERIEFLGRQRDFEEALLTAIQPPT